MKTEKSCGIIPIIKENNTFKVVLIKQRNEVVGFPKGHVEKNETEEETALRECFEETNLKVNIVNNFKKQIEYYMPEYNAYKIVVFFIGLIDEINLMKQEKEIKDIFIVTYEEAFNLISYDDTKKVLIEAIEHLKTKK